MVRLEIPHGKRWKLLFASAVITTGDGGDGGDGGAAPGDGVPGDGDGGDEGDPGEDGDDGGADDLLTDEERAKEDRLKAEAAEKENAPENYEDFAAPEGVTLDSELTGEFKGLAKEVKLSQKKAQRFVDLGTKVMQKTMDRVYVMHEERKAAWFKEAAADPELKDDIALGADKSAATRAFHTITEGSEKARRMVDELGIGNHPEFIRIFLRVSKIMNMNRAGNPTDVARSIFGKTFREMPSPGPDQEPDSSMSIFNHPSRNRGK